MNRELRITAARPRTSAQPCTCPRCSPPKPMGLNALARLKALASLLLADAVPKPKLAPPKVVAAVREEQVPPPPDLNAAIRARRK